MFLPPFFCLIRPWAFARVALYRKKFLPVGHISCIHNSNLIHLNRFPKWGSNPS
jgi:hypothetical protein